MKKIAVVLATITISMSALVLPAKAAKHSCTVTDPTGTPLNIRATPYGEVINDIRNGKKVYIINIAYDYKGRPWAEIGIHGYKLGWVLREFISCYDSSK